MRLTSIYFALLLLKTAASAQTAPADSQMTQVLLSEVHQLRQDLQTAAATIQRVQIVMYRLQAESAQLNRATQLLEQARAGCDGAEWQQKAVTAEIERAEIRRRDAQNSSERSAAEEQISRLRSSVEELTNRQQQCQIDKADAETQLRTEQGKMNDLQDQLDRLDRVLAGYGRK